MEKSECLSWTVDEVGKWLDLNGLGQFKEVFAGIFVYKLVIVLFACVYF